MSVGSVGNVGSVGSGGVMPSQGAGGASPASPTGLSSGEVAGAGSQPGIQAGGDINIGNDNSTSIIQMSTQDFMALRGGCQTSGASGVGAMGGMQEGGMDLQKLVEMMMMMMMLKMMQDMMQQMSA